MNNRTQQRFDRSIADAVAEIERVKLTRPRRDVRTGAVRLKQTKPKGRLYLDPILGTVWDPNG